MARDSAGRIATIPSSLYWGLPFLRRAVPLATLAIAIIALYLFNLNGVGVLGPDEPRYQAIGRAMAITGDLVTPRLWGVPWFEKPPLLYWMTAGGTALGLGPDLCGRLPVALMSLLFLGVTLCCTQAEFGILAGSIAAAGLATSGGWVAYSTSCVTDLPLSVCFGLSVYLALPLLRTRPDASRIALRFCLLGISMGLAVLAKGLVPLALALPMLWFLRRHRRFWGIGIGSAGLIALPWYTAVYLRNGSAFIDDFFIKQHFQRIYSDALQHIQPWYYYFPVLLAALFPWTPLFVLLFRNGEKRDDRHAFLLTTVVWGILFFSISRNKLNGYLLPLLPLLFVLLGACWEHRHAYDLPRRWLVGCAVLSAAIPLGAFVLPQVLAAGRLSTLALPALNRTVLFFMLLPLMAVLLSRRSWAGVTLVLSIVAAYLYLKATAFPVLDRTVSARALWRSTAALTPEICNGGTNRDWLYGLSYYRGASYPTCDQGKFRYILRTKGRGVPVLEALQ